MKKLFLVVTLLFVMSGAQASADEFVCKTEKHTIIVKNDGSLYRSWNQPKEISDKPDMEVKGGTASVQGAGPCVHREFHFKKGGVEFEIDTPAACTEKMPPKDAKGVLFVFVKDELKSQYWCH